ncbi:MAG: calcium/sodium antiporter [Pseudomonadota bacterium]
MVLDIAFVILGLVILLVAGDMLVRGAVILARLLNVPALLIGLTIVAFGTSAPELAVTVKAVLSGDNGIAIGNIVGSNIANILLVLGLPALIAPLCLKTPGLRRHGVTMMGATILFAYVIYGKGVLDTQWGLIFLLFILAYIAFVGVSAMRKGKDEAGFVEEVEELTAHPPKLPKTIFLVVGGLIGLPLGGALLVQHGADLARSLSIREDIIGLTIVAFGTSLPELATVWAAALKKQADVAVGNIIGSNIFNILFVGGAAGLFGTTTFTEELARYDLPVMIFVTLVLLIMVLMKSKITRGVGVVFMVIYIAYILFISVNAA